MRVFIKGDNIKLGQLLKKMGLISTGGQAKSYLSTNSVVYQDEQITNRGKKIRVSTLIWINDEVYQILPDKE